MSAYLDGLKHAAKILSDYRPANDSTRWWHAYNDLAAEIERASCERCAESATMSYYDEDRDRVVACKHPNVDRWAWGEGSVVASCEELASQWERESRCNTTYAEIRRDHAKALRDVLNGKELT